MNSTTSRLRRTGRFSLILGLALCGVSSMVEAARTNYTHGTCTVKSGTVHCPNAKKCRTLGGGAVHCPNATTCSALGGGTVICNKNANPPISCFAYRGGKAYCRYAGSCGGMKPGKVFGKFCNFNTK